VSLAGHAVVLRTEPPGPAVPRSRPWRASIVPFPPVGWRLRPGLTSGPARCACVVSAPSAARGHWRPLPSSITTSATVARHPVPSRRARPCPRLRLRAAPALALASLTAPGGALLWSRAMNSGKTVATGPAQVFAPTPPEDPKRAPNL